jgi:hypothetical protein
MPFGGRQATASWEPMFRPFWSSEPMPRGMSHISTSNNRFSTNPHYRSVRRAIAPIYGRF